MDWNNRCSQHTENSKNQAELNENKKRVKWNAINNTHTMQQQMTWSKENMNFFNNTKSNERKEK